VLCSPDPGPPDLLYFEVVLVGVTNRVRTRSLRGQWWLYSELHLKSSARFGLYVLLTDTDLQIDGEDVTIERDKFVLCI